MSGAVQPQLRAIVLDTEDAKGLAEFYHQLFGWEYLTDLTSDDATDWCTLQGAAGVRLSFERVDHLERAQWPDPKRPQQAHLDFVVSSGEELEAFHRKAVGLGAEVLATETDDPDEQIYIYADPSGHPFCVFVPMEENPDLSESGRA
ncbi:MULTISPECIES: VOC family protein [Kocuria]|uniref:VOC family protein n=1 Tax=Kocuria subflava TaxID=1736139 RepID=A0A846TWZ2_9MICC|nr:MULTISPECIES: VOC family protein [Kocuria]NKE10164.1 VOC family protein [Kocuria subflava]